MTEDKVVPFGKMQQLEEDVARMWERARDLEDVDIGLFLDTGIQEDLRETISILLRIEHRLTERLRSRRFGGVGEA